MCFLGRGWCGKFSLSQPCYFLFPSLKIPPPPNFNSNLSLSLSHTHTHAHTHAHTHTHTHTHTHAHAHTHTHTHTHTHQTRCHALFKQVHEEKHLKGRANDAVGRGPVSTLPVAWRTFHAPFEKSVLFLDIQRRKLVAASS